MPAEVWQYNSAVEIARFFHMRLDFGGVVPMVGRDLYQGGRGLMHGKGQSATARVFLDAEARPTNFSTADRYADLPGGLVRATWTTPIAGWEPDGDRFGFTSGRAVWQLPEGPLEYLDFRLPAGARRFNTQPVVIP